MSEVYDKRGSVWRKWDLHFHTPSSFDYKDQRVTNEDIVSRLIDENISLVAITDHHVIDVERILELNEIAGDKIQFLPGIELRAELGGSDSVHFIGIFPLSRKQELQALATKIRGRLDITPADIVKKGDKSIYHDFQDTANLFHSLDGIVSIHAGTKSNSFEGIKINGRSFRGALKRDLAHEQIDIFEIGKKEDIEIYEKKIFPNLDSTYPLIYGSDNHNITEYSVDYPTWVKADRTIQGLRQIIYEPENRVFIGEKPLKTKLVNSNKTKYIQQVKFKKEGSNESEVWFEKTNPIKLNHDLVAIIGNKGMGKSALADVIALTSNSKRDVSDFSFLNRQKFRHKSNNKAKHFRATTIWQDGSLQEKNLDETVDSQEVELVHYLPQKYIEKICNEIGVKEESEFDKQLEKVIFSHVSDSDKLGYDSLNELLEYKTNEVYERIRSISNQLDSLNRTIIKLNNKLSESYKESLQKDLKVKKKELESLQKNPPGKVPEPQSSEQVQEKIERLNSKIDEVREKIDSLEQKKKGKEKDLRKVTQHISSSDKIIEKLKNFEKDYEKLSADLSKPTENVEIDLDDIISLSIDYGVVEKKRDEWNLKNQKIKEDLSLDGDGTITRDLKANELYLVWLQDKLNEPNKKYQHYLDEKKEWQKQKEAIIGNQDTQDTIEYFKNQLKYIDKIPEILEEKKKEREGLTVEIHDELKKLKSIYRNLYKPVVDYIRELEINDAEFSINFDVRIASQNFKEDFLGMINKGVSGSYYGDEKANELITKIHDKFDFDSTDDLKIFLKELVESIEFNLQKEDRANIEAQLRKGIDPIDIYNYIFNLSYLSPKYELKMGKKEIGQLSPGERGTLLLIFYLLVDQDDRPIIIDQPEENLDNETVFDTLVPCIKKAKENRQIIIVTHNPNLAVVCDAEQIISANIDKKNGNEVSYTTGSIENPKINKEILDVLEGTRPAFDNRGSKYIV